MIDVEERPEDPPAAITVGARIGVSEDVLDDPSEVTVAIFRPCSEVSGVLDHGHGSLDETAVWKPDRDHL